MIYTKYWNLIRNRRCRKNFEQESISRWPVNSKMSFELYLLAIIIIQNNITDIFYSGIYSISKNLSLPKFISTKEDSRFRNILYN